MSLVRLRQPVRSVMTPRHGGFVRTYTVSGGAKRTLLLPPVGAFPLKPPRNVDPSASSGQGCPNVRRTSATSHHSFGTAFRSPSPGWGVTLDATDRKILRLLQEDARRSYRSIGETVDLGAPSVHARVQRLEREGYIRGYHADIDPEKVGRAMTAFVSIGLEGARKGETPRTEMIAHELRKDPDVLEVHAITGEDDLLVKVRTSDIRGLERLLLRALEPLEGVRRTTTTIVVRTLLERQTPP